MVKLTTEYKISLFLQVGCLDVMVGSCDIILSAITPRAQIRCNRDKTVTACHQVRQGL